MEHGRNDIARLLLEHHAEVNTFDNDGWSPLLWAAKKGRTTMVQMLMDAGADVDHRLASGEKSTHLVVAHPDTLRILIAHGADINSSAIDPPYTPLMFAVEAERIDTVRLLIASGADVNKFGETGRTAMVLAIQHGTTTIAGLLLDAGADANCKLFCNQTLLHKAVIYSREEICGMLLEYNADVDAAEDVTDDTALHLVDDSTPVALVARLLKRGANPEKRNKDGYTAIVEASRVGNVDIVRYLISKRVELNIRTCSGRGGALHLASNVEVAKALVQAGADRNLRDATIGTPVTAVCWDQGNKEDLIRYLIEDAEVDVNIRDGVIGHTLSAACGWSTPVIVKLLLEKGVDVHRIDDMGRSAIHFAAFHNLEIFDVLLQAGALVGAVDKMARSVLHWAAIGGVPDIVQRVLSLSGSSVNDRDADG